ncbi:MAG: hypothetical protein QXT58_04585, partial [Archaeoglobaceae archaeon]
MQEKIAIINKKLEDEFFHWMDNRQRAALAEEIEAEYGVTLKWVALAGTPRRGDPEKRLEPPRRTGWYYTPSGGWLSFFEIYEGELGDPVMNEGEIGVCVFNKKWGGNPHLPGYQVLVWAVPKE